MADEGDKAVQVKEVVEETVQTAQETELLDEVLQQALETVQKSRERRKCKRQLWVEDQFLKFPWLSTAFLTELLPKSSSWFLPKTDWEKEACTARRVLRLLTTVRFGLKLRQLAAAKGGQ
ncbi:unnamed protein product [Symbiodinium necroappetens]|uniref:Uncharacterized protein n=1 Tax=Symbiodinium necroappetens TaxID=1628268 RepID=A0A813BZ02_9DINO|nr:unnamed protein product [Symbiodinium necroappetens]